MPPANPANDEDQGKIVDTPAVADLDGPGKPPTIIVGTNEEYLTETRATKARSTPVT